MTYVVQSPESTGNPTNNFWVIHEDAWTEYIRAGTPITPVAEYDNYEMALGDAAKRRKDASAEQVEDGGTRRTGVESTD